MVDQNFEVSSEVLNKYQQAASQIFFICKCNALIFMDCWNNLSSVQGANTFRIGSDLAYTGRGLFCDL